MASVYMVQKGEHKDELKMGKGTDSRMASITGGYYQTHLMSHEERRPHGTR